MAYGGNPKDTTPEAVLGVVLELLSVGVRSHRSVESGEDELGEGLGEVVHIPSSQIHLRTQALYSFFALTS